MEVVLLFTWLLFCRRCTERVFGPAQWQELRRKLAVWKVSADLPLFKVKLWPEVEGIGVWEYSVCIGVHRNFLPAF